LIFACGFVSTVLTIDDLDLDADFDPDAHDAKIAALFESGNDVDEFVRRILCSLSQTLLTGVFSRSMTDPCFSFAFVRTVLSLLQDGEKPTWDDEDGGLEGYGDESIVAGFGDETYGDEMDMGMGEGIEDDDMADVEMMDEEDYDAPINMVRSSISLSLAFLLEWRDDKTGVVYADRSIDPSICPSRFVGFRRP
jgi:hypothetical protein